MVLFIVMKSKGAKKWGVKSQDAKILHLSEIELRSTQHWQPIHLEPKRAANVFLAEIQNAYYKYSMHGYFHAVTAFH